MKKLNNKGYTLIELMAVVVILSVLTAIMVPSVNYLINMNKENNYKDLKSNLIHATKVLFSDYRYEVTLENTHCADSTEEKSILKIGSHELTDSKVPIQVLVDENNISVDKDGQIWNPLDKTKKLDLAASYVLVKYQCGSKDFRYEIETGTTDYLTWIE